MMENDNIRSAGWIYRVSNATERVLPKQPAGMLRGSFWTLNGEARFKVVRSGIMLREAFPTFPRH
jgi:hypothetical protein